MDLRDAVVVVTGASAGIGWATARAFARRRATLVVSARREDRLRGLADLIARRNVTVLAVRCDVGSPEEIEALRDRTLAEFGRCDVLVSNAGVPGGGELTEMAPETIESIVRINLLGVIHGARTFLPSMLEHGRGHIVNVASLAGRYAMPGSSVYSATKAAVISFSEALNYEVSGRGVRVTAVNPGLVATEGFPHRDALAAGRVQASMVMRPERVAEAIVRTVRRGRAPEVSIPRWQGSGQAFRILAPPVYRYGIGRAGAGSIHPTDAPPVED